MKTVPVIWLMVMACVLNIRPAFGQSESKNNKIIADSKTAKAEFLAADALMKGIFDTAYGYVIFPNVGKGGIGVGEQQATGLFMNRTLL